MDLSAFTQQAPDRQTLEILTRCLLREIAKLGGVSDFRPQLAGRFYKPAD
jgi:hypothetical protein